VLLKQQVADNTKTSSYSPVPGTTQLSTHPSKSPDGENMCLFLNMHAQLN